jgi:hypothetical protein
MAMLKVGIRRLRFINSPTERTTAGTDLLLAIQTASWAIIIYNMGQTSPWKAMIWVTAFSLMALAALLGTVAHGLAFAETIRRRLWRGLSLALGLTLACFLVGFINDMWGQAVAMFALPVALFLGFGFFGITLIIPSTFLVFIIYEAIILLFALIGYGWLMVMGQLAGSGWMTLGILLTLFAAVVQTRKKLIVTVIWPFDHNGLFHLIQFIANVFILLGLHASF